MQSDRIAAIDKQLEMLKSRRSQLVARASVEERRLRTRQAIILGTWLMTNHPDLVDEIKKQLERPQDRKAFGLNEAGNNAVANEGDRNA